jgi:hypothetical protein
MTLLYKKLKSKLIEFIEHASSHNSICATNEMHIYLRCTIFIWNIFRYGKYLITYEVHNFQLSAVWMIWILSPMSFVISAGFKHSLRWLIQFISQSCHICGEKIDRHLQLIEFKVNQTWKISRKKILACVVWNSVVTVGCSFTLVTGETLKRVPSPV